MKNCILTSFALALSIITYAQKQSITWGEEFKLRKGSGEIEVLCSDETGVYVKEKHLAIGTYFVVGATLHFGEAEVLQVFSSLMVALITQAFSPSNTRTILCYTSMITGETPMWQVQPKKLHESLNTASLIVMQLPWI